MSSNPIIKVEHISKHYLLNKNAELKSDTLYGSIGNRLKNFSTKKQTEEFWALNDVSFEVQQGDRVGIIGRNGAGKSTLLKILSRITAPTKGRIEISGRLASLLEVGTGFHGDLSGRENIYLNGSILGMSKQEIGKKFDEIVAFAEVEKFLDTPVKRYSSGMYVRLAFAVAAHLEPEILIVDEVLAVGDAAFQKKCIGKMEESSQKDGKTILFVSHNMGQISALCTRGILLNKGRVEMQDNIPNIVSTYFKEDVGEDVFDFKYENDLKKEFCITQISVLNVKNEKTKNFAHNEPMRLLIKIKKNKFLNDVLLGVYFSDILEKKLFTVQTSVSDRFLNDDEVSFYLTLPDSILVPNTYNFSVGIHIPNIQVIDEKRNVTGITIYDNGSEFYKYVGVDVGAFFVNGKWEFEH